jgi:pimeloyl-ACP methyl ester carboxylesterase
VREEFQKEGLMDRDATAHLTGRVAKLCAAAIVGLTLLALPSGAAAEPAAAQSSYEETVSTMKAFAAPGTPSNLNKVRVLKQGDPKADHVLVLVPGTSGGATYFEPLAKALTKQNPDYQVWTLDRRENLLEDHSTLDEEINGEIDGQQLFDYYLGWIGNPAITEHFEAVPTSETEFAYDWGMNVAVQDLRVVVKKAAKKDRTVVLGGHSLGGSIVTAYASWDFGGKPGAKGLSGLLLIDGGSLGGDPPTAEEATTSLQSLDASSSPFLDLLGSGLPWSAGVFNAVGSSLALDEPTVASIFQNWFLLPASLKPPVPVTNRAQYGYAVDAGASPPNLALVQSHIGGLAETGDPIDWQDGELGTVERNATAFRGIEGMDGTAWYHPKRLSLDSSAINNGVDNPAQQVLGDKAIFGDKVKMPIYAFQTSLGYNNGANRVVDAAEQLAAQSGVTGKDLLVVSKPNKYAHIDPLSASPQKNAFLKKLVPFLKKRVG